MIHIPLLRAGKAYRSLSTVNLSHLGTGEPIAEISQANPGLIARDLRRIGAHRQALEAVDAADLIEMSKRAAEHFLHADLPLGDTVQSPENYLQQLSSTTGLPMSLGRTNMAKIHFVMSEMETVLAGLTRGVNLAVLDQGWCNEEGRCVSYRRETDSLGVILPSNSPGVHSLWIPAFPFKVPLVLKPGRQEPWTPYRIAQSLLAAGCPPGAVSLYPTDYPGASEILLGSGRSMLFGDRSTVDPWRGDERVQIHGPGWSKIVLGIDQSESWQDYLGLMVDSVALNSGRSCINASGVWTTSLGREVARGLAAELAGIEAQAMDDPEAKLAAFPSLQAAQRMSDHLDAQLAVPGAIDMTAEFRTGSRVAVVDGFAFVLPTVVYCADPAHPLAHSEFLFPFVSVVEVPESELPDRIGSTLVASVISDDLELRRAFMDSTNVDRLNLGALPTTQLDWDQPHEGNLFDHLYRQRAFQAPDLVPSSKPADQQPPSGASE